MVLTALEYTGGFIIGTMVGSFLNVVIHRVPRGESIVRPASHCPHCRRPIKPWENIPILSYLALRGRCAGCGLPISIRYPAVEAAMGVVVVLLLHYYHWSVDLLFFGALAGVLLALSLIDIATYRLPNRVVLTGAVMAVVLTLFLRREHLASMVLGGLLGAAMLSLMGLIGTLLFRRPALGMGDIKLAGMIGLYLGPAKTAGMFVLGVFSAAIIGGGLLLIGGGGWRQRIPFGPHLALGAVVSLLWGGKLWSWYWALTIR